MNSPLYATDQNGQNIPINFRIYDKSESKTKNDYFMDMLSEVLSWGAKIQFITGDSWYSSIANLKTIRKHGIRFMFGIVKLLYYPYRIRKKLEIIHRLICISFIMI